MINRYVMQMGIALALSSLAGCTGFFHKTTLPASSIIQPTASADESIDAASHWRQKARELRSFADRHDIEAEVLLRDRSPEDAGLIQQRLALARQLRLAAGQVEQRAEEPRSQVTMEWSSEFGEVAQ